MSFWFWHGLQKGVQTTHYPRGLELHPRSLARQAGDNGVWLGRRSFRNCCQLSDRRHRRTRQFRRCGAAALHPLPAVPLWQLACACMAAGLRVDDGWA